MAGTPRAAHTADHEQGGGEPGTNDHTAPGGPVTLVIVNAGVSDPSSTRLLADRIAQKTIDALRAAGTTATVRSIDLGPLATDIAQGIVSGMLNPKVQSVMELLAGADAVIAATPVYKAAVSGLFKSFVDLVDNDLLIARPVVLAATGGSARHAMVVDEHLRPLFAFLRALPMPTSLYATPEDWGSADLGKRIDRAAQELSVLLRSGAGRQIADRNWGDYQHQFGGNATAAERSVDDVDFDTDLMRLATGGGAPVRKEEPRRDH
ncbi:MAG: NAD(P)H-dependent oxidoreductase [Streptomyces sp.]|jgi:FMN reductase|uniref:CE1759 family FMN reductase n=1 Tax=Streptomyces sp. TaxID=1931 RepID=UPI0025F9690C|nr:CE1759 family FMN reductase [Streptomyces sp.]MBW8795550.1 NAD(P)H-dependent oxidoreductase [Streptomyces sp.]